MRIHNEVKSKTLNQVLEESTGKPAPEGRVFYCEICEKNFDEHLLHTHNAMHQNLGKHSNYNCFICNRNYDSEVNFKIHMRVHEEQGSTFKPGRSKALHNMNIPMPYPCGYCDKRFSKPHEKVKHERVHTGEKPVRIFCLLFKTILKLFFLVQMWSLREMLPSVILINPTSKDSHWYSTIRLCHLQQEVGFCVFEVKFMKIMKCFQQIQVQHSLW